MKTICKALFIVLTFVMISGLPVSVNAQSPKYPAKLCNNCGFGQKSKNCVKCGKWVGSTTIYARLCVNCGFGNKKDNCVKCGRWVGSTGVPVQLCNNCGFGQKSKNCVKCGRWTSEFPCLAPINVRIDIHHKP